MEGQGETGLPDGRKAEGLVTFRDVQDRLVEALDVLGRLPDPSRHASWQRVSASGFWQQVTIDAETARQNYTIDEFDQDAEPIRTRGASRREVDRMEEALDWALLVSERDRKLVGLAIGTLVRGKARVPWGFVANKMGWGGHPDALRKRYGAALRAIAMSVNAPASAARRASSPRMAR